MRQKVESLPLDWSSAKVEKSINENYEDGWYVHAFGRTDAKGFRTGFLVIVYRKDDD